MKQHDYTLWVEPTRSTASSAYRVMTSKQGNQFVGRYKKSKSKQHQNDLIHLIKQDAIRHSYKPWPVDVPLKVVVTFAYPCPASAPLSVRLNGGLKVTKPDLDNSAKVLLDALTQSGQLADDRQVAVLTLAKIMVAQGAVPFIQITMSEIEPFSK